jgi:hypothetical protein
MTEARLAECVAEIERRELSQFGIGACGMMLRDLVREVVRCRAEARAR